MKKIFTILAVLGLLFLCLAAYLGYNNYHFQQHAQHAEGQITDLRYSRSNNSSGVWYPVVTFTDESGQEQTFESSVGSSGYRNSLGERVGVVYDRDDMESAKIDDVMGLYLGTIILGVFPWSFFLSGALVCAWSVMGVKTNTLCRMGSL